MPTIDSLTLSVSTNAALAQTGIEQLTASLEGLRKVTKGGLGLKSLNTNLEKMVATLGAGGFKAADENLRKLQTTIAAIGAVTPEARDNLHAVADAVKAVNKETARVAPAAKRFIPFALGVRILSKAMRAGLEASNAYVENLNLFNVTMGEFADRANDYAEKVQSIIGIDASEWIRGQGVFKQIASGFGLAEEQAYTFSKGLTQVAYDIASFYNISTAEAMQKVQAGVAGEIEPMRRLGYAIDQNSLQQIANARGINMRVTQMNQAQKAELRYVAIMEQSGNVMGDMSRTLITTANQMRILKSQISQLARAFGNMLIPAVNAVLPVLIGFANTLTSVFNAIAKLFGFVLPSIDYSGSLGEASDSAGELEDHIGGAGGAAKKLKRTLLGFDELNLLQDKAGGGGGGGGKLGQLGGSLGLDLQDYDFLGGLTDEIGKLDVATQAWGASLALAALAIGKIWGWRNVFNILQAGAALAAEIDLSFKLNKLWLQSGSVKYLLGNLASTALTGVFLGSIFKKMGFFGGNLKSGLKYGSAISLGVDAGVSIIASYKNVAEDPSKAWSGPQIITDLKGLIEGALSGFLFGGTKGAVIGLAVSTGVTLLTKIAALSIEPKVPEPERWGNVHLVEEEIKDLAERYINPAVTANISVVKANIEKSKNLQTTFDDSYQKFLLGWHNLTIDSLPTVNVPDLTPDQIDQLQADVDGVIQAAQEQLTQRTINLQGLVSLFDGNESAAGVSSDSIMLSRELSADLERAGKELGELLSKSFTEGATPDYDAILSAYAEVDRLLQIQQQSKQKAELSVLTQSLSLSDLDEETFIKTANKWSARVNELRADLAESAKSLEIESLTNINTSFAMLEGVEQGSETWERYYPILESSILSYAELLGKADQIDAETVNALFTNLSPDDALYTLRNFLGSLNIEEYIAPQLAELTADGRKAFRDAFLKLWLPSDSVNLMLTPISDSLQDKTLGAEEVAQNVRQAIVDGLGVPIDVADTLGLSTYELLPDDARDSLTQYLKSSIDDTDKLHSVLAALGATSADLEKAFAAPVLGAQTLNDQLDELPTDKTVRINIQATMSAFTRRALNAVGSLSDGKNGFFGSLKNIGGLLAPRYASGGFPTKGSMFIAGESGPELVGNIGGRTGVANQGQIADALSSSMSGGASEGAIAKAVASAIEGMVVECDGERLGRIAVRSINQYQRRSGRVELQL